MRFVGGDERDLAGAEMDDGFVTDPFDKLVLRGDLRRASQTFDAMAAVRSWV